MPPTETWFWCSLHESPHRGDMADDDCLLVGPYFTCDEARDWGTSVRADPENERGGEWCRACGTDHVDGRWTAQCSRWEGDHG